jgi:hypothetical protein
MDKKNMVEKTKIVVTIFEDEDSTQCEIELNGNRKQMLLAVSGLAHDLKKKLPIEHLRLAFNLGLENDELFDI